MDVLIIAVVGLVAVASARVLEGRVRIAAPLLLVLVGIGVSFLPFVPAVTVDPEWIIAGILPPLLYSAAVSVPAMNFRREFNAISGLSVALVVISAVVLGVFFAWVIPGIDLWWGIALGAIVSPTDAVATSIVKRSGLSGRVVSVLEGESLLNDATALVLLRTAIAGAAASVSFWGVVGNFAFAVIVAVALGWVVGVINLWVRSRLTDSTVNTVLSFTVPFLASIPAELLGASGLVAAVTAGLITGHGAARRLPPQHRLSDSQNWKSIELVLEGAIFLIMGLELAGLIADVRHEGTSLWIAGVVAAAALVIILLVRAAYITPLLAGLRRRARRGEVSQPRLHVIQQRLEDPDLPIPERQVDQRLAPRGRRRGFTLTPERLARFSLRIRRRLSDIDYLLKAPLGWREGGVLVWAGMRGAITLAAAQTLPSDTPSRSLLILTAFIVATASLLLQGSTLAAFVRWIKPAGPNEHAEIEERSRILALLGQIKRDTVDTLSSGDAAITTDQEPDPTKQLDLAVIEAQREALLDARDHGTYAAETLSGALANLDADQISIELKGAPAEP